jgi:prolipoprotein diacylglyceryltransferase
MPTSLIFLLGGASILFASRGLSDRYIVGFVGSRLVPTYAFFQSAGHVFGLAVFMSVTPPEYRREFLWLIAVVCFPAAAIGARVASGVTDYPQDFLPSPVRFILTADRYSAFGGVIAGIGVYVVAVAFFDWPLALWVADGFALSYIGAEFFSRIGCHANGCCYGRPAPVDRRTMVPTVEYKNPLQKASWHGESRNKPIYAAPWCMAWLNLALFTLLLRLAEVSPLEWGVIGGLGWMLYPYCRLINEFLRADRRAIGKEFTFFILGVMFLAGYWTFTISRTTAPGGNLKISIQNLQDAEVLAVLAVTYLVLFLVYGFLGAEFTRADFERAAPSNFGDRSMSTPSTAIRASSPPGDSRRR